MGVLKGEEANDLRLIGLVLPSSCLEVPAFCCFWGEKERDVCVCVRARARVLEEGAGGVRGEEEGIRLIKPFVMAKFSLGVFPNICLNNLPTE